MPDEVDVVVVGAGGAGLASAVSVAEAGMTCALIEQAARPGGTTSYSVGSICVSLVPPEGSDTAEDFLEDTSEYLGPQGASKTDPELRTLLARESGETLRWLQRHGVLFAGPHIEPPHRRPRLYTAIPDGTAFVSTLQRAAERLGVSFSYHSRVSDLLTSQGRVIGVRAESHASSIQVHARRGTVLACGDFAANEELRTRYLSPAAARGIPVNPTSRGDGLRLGATVSAAWRNMDVAYAPQVRFVPATVAGKEDAATKDALTSSVSEFGPEALQSIGRHAMKRAHMAPATKAALLVSTEGELIDWSGAADTLALTDSRLGYVLVDERWRVGGPLEADRISSAPTIGFALLEDYRIARPDLITTAESTEAMAARLKVPPAALARAIRVGWGGSFQPPLLALGPVRPYITVTEGSLAVDRSLRVLDAHGSVIPGLYAAGASGQGGLLLWGHGLHLTWALTSGRLMGRVIREALPA